MDKHPIAFVWNWLDDGNF